MFDDSKIYTVKELAVVIKMSTDWVYGQIAQKKIPCIMMGNRARFLGWKLNEWMKEGTK